MGLLVCGQMTGFANRVRLGLFLGDVIYVPSYFWFFFFRGIFLVAFVSRDVVFTYFFPFLFFLHTVSLLQLTVGPVVGWVYFMSGMLAARDEGSVSVFRATFWSTSRRPWARKVPVNTGLEWAFVVV